MSLLKKIQNSLLQEWRSVKRIACILHGHKDVVVVVRRKRIESYFMDLMLPLPFVRVRTWYRFRCRRCGHQTELVFQDFIEKNKQNDSRATD
jgi:hypothetical protein